MKAVFWTKFRLSVDQAPPSSRRRPSAVTHSTLEPAFGALFCVARFSFKRFHFTAAHRSCKAKNRLCRGKRENACSPYARGKVCFRDAPRKPSLLRSSVRKAGIFARPLVESVFLASARLRRATGERTLLLPTGDFALQIIQTSRNAVHEVTVIPRIHRATVRQ